MKVPRIRVAVALVEEGRLLLVRHQKARRSYWLLPGGGVEFGETLAETAVREVEEETGLKVEIHRLLLVSETLAPDSSRHLVHIVFTARRAGGQLRVGEEERVAEAKFVPAAEIGSLDLHPPIHAALVNFLQEGRDAPPGYLGSLWVD